MTNETAAMAALRNFFDEKEWRYLADEDGAIRGLTGGDNGQWHWYAHLNADGRILVFKAFCPLNVSARRRAAAAEYLMRANWGLNFGNFEMDWSDGQVSFRTSVATEDRNVGTEALNHLVYANQSTMDRYLPGLMMVACGSAMPKKAITEAEMDLAQPPADGGKDETATSTAGDNNGPCNGREPQKFSPEEN